MRRLVASKRWLAAVAGAVLLVLLAAVAGALYLRRDDGGGQLARDARDAASTVIAPRGAFSAALVQVAEGIDTPVGIVPIPDGSGRFAVIEQQGRVRTITAGKTDAEPLLDITDLADDSETESGLVGIAFHPGFRDNGRIFAFYTPSRLTKVVEYQVVGGKADRASERTVFEYTTNFQKHLGGTLVFGPDGYLYIAVGDGGPQRDGERQGQDLSSVRGKILRIDVDRGSPYTIPPGNPFVDRTDARPEIWLYGLRNPWRISFDRETNDLWLPDVGQASWEEINVQPASAAPGRNFGWSRREGTFCQRQRECRADASGLTDPIFQYAHGAGCAVIGGYVYRGQAIPALRGAFLFADYCDGGIYALRQEAGQWVATKLADSPGLPTSFGQDEAGELYIASATAGTVSRIVAAP